MIPTRSHRAAGFAARIETALAAVGFVAAAAVWLLTPGHLSAADKWPDIDPAELKLAAPRVEPNADAEVLLWDVRVTDDIDSDAGTAYEHYLRIKIFTERGRETESKVDISYTNDQRVKNIEGRTISPDGKITELRSQDVYDRTIVSIGGAKLKAKSFVLPAVVPGALIEYRWREIQGDSAAHYVPLPFQREIPVQLVRYHIKPLDVAGLGLRMRTQAFNLTKTPELVPEPKGYTLIQLRGVPALRREPYMPPELSTKAWLLLFYEETAAAELPADRFWSKFATELHEGVQPAIKVTADIRKAAKEAVAAGAPSDQMAQAIVKYVRARVKPPEPGKPFKENKDVNEALKRGVGTDQDLTLAFAAIASAAGLEVKLALAADRGTHVVDPAMKQPFFFSYLVAAVRMPNGWLFVDPANQYVPDGHLRWQQEGVPALLLDSKAPAFVTTPVAPASHSVERRSGTLTLLANGTLQGELTFEYSGHLAADRRDDDAGRSPEQRTQAIQAQLAGRLPGARVTGVAAEHQADLDKPYLLRLRITVPGYAERTGSRTFVQPAVLQKGIEAVFSSSSRQHRIAFPFAWTEQDALTLELPGGYQVEPGQGPVGAVLDNGNAGRYQATVAADAGRITYTRTLAVGGPGRNQYIPADYGAVKNFFDAVHRGDAHTVALRSGGAGGAQ